MLDASGIRSLRVALHVHRHPHAALHVDRRLHAALSVDRRLRVVLLLRRIGEDDWFTGWFADERMDGSMDGWTDDILTLLLLLCFEKGEKECGPQYVAQVRSCSVVCLL